MKSIALTCITLVLTAAFLMLFPWIPKASFAESPPVPVVQFPFDVSRQDNTVNQEFRIRDFRSYYFAIRFNYFGEADLYRVITLVGDGSKKYPGISIPIHMKIVKQDSGNSPPKLIYENTVLTEHCFAHGFERKQTDGNFLRQILAIDLKPGIYRVEASTIKDSPEFSGTPTYLQIEFHSELRFIPNCK
jgi:hypothetical protein